MKSDPQQYTTRTQPLAPLVLGGLLFLASTSLVSAAIILDRSPGAYPGVTLEPDHGAPGSQSNVGDGGNWADSFSFGSAETLTGMGLYSGSDWGTVGQAVTIKLWYDNNGVPGSLIQEFNTTVSVVNTEGASSVALITQKYAAFTTPISLAANTVYWIEMSGGNGTQLALLGVTDPAAGLAGYSALFNGDTFQGLHTPGIGDVSMRLYGFSAVPEPPTCISGALALLLPLSVPALRRLRKKG
jgi:hypothetical protein